MQPQQGTTPDSPTTASKSFLETAPKEGKEGESNGRFCHSLVSPASGHSGNIIPQPDLPQVCFPGVGRRMCMPVTCQADEPNIVAEAREKASKVTTLRFVICGGGIGMGNENSSFDILRCWQKLSPGSLQKAEFIFSMLETTALNYQVPGWKPEQYNLGIQRFIINGLPCDFIPNYDLSELPVLPFSITGLTRNNPLSSARATASLSLKPYHWFLEGNALITTSLSDSRPKIQPLTLPAENHLPMDECDIMTSSEICEIMRNHPHISPAKASFVLELIDKAERNEIEMGVIYGLHRTRRKPEELLADYLDVVSSSALNTNGAVFFYIANDLTGSLEFLHKKLESVSALGRLISNLGTESVSTLMKCGPRQKVIVVFGGPVPKAAYEKLVAVSTLPVIMEGANTAELCQSLGRPYLPVGLESCPFPLETVPSDAPRSQLLYLISLLISYSRESAQQTIAGLKKLYEHNDVQNLKPFLILVSGSRLEEYRDLVFLHLSQSSGCLNNVNREELSNLEYEFTKWLLHQNSRVNIAVSDLIECFLTEAPVTALDFTKKRTTETRLKNISSLFEQQQAGCFLEYLETQYFQLLQQFIKQATDKNSGLTVFFNNLRQQAHAPENNLLVAALNQIPLDVMV